VTKNITKEEVTNHSRKKVGNQTRSITKAPGTNCSRKYHFYIYLGRPGRFHEIPRSLQADIIITGN